jgi:hypothetical protein
MVESLQIKLGFGLFNISFGSIMADVEILLGQPEAVELLDEIEESQSTVWHYWELGFSLFFSENKNQTFYSVEIDNPEALLWGVKIFTLKEKQIIELFKNKGINTCETEIHEWGEKRLSFDDSNIDFYFEKNKLCSINYGLIDN